MQGGAGMNRHELINSLVKRCIQSGENIEMNMDIFDWMAGVGLYAIYKAYEVTKEQYIYDYLDNWCERNLHKAYDIKTVNSTAPMAMVLGMSKQKGQAGVGLFKVCKDMADFTLHSAARTQEGGLEHTVARHEDINVKTPIFHQQIWADSLFMSCIFLAGMYEATGETAYRDESIHQMLIHFMRLQDKKTGLLGWR